MSDNQSYYQQEEEDDEEIQVDENGYKHVKDAVLFAIEVNASMLEKPSEYNEAKPDTGLPPVVAALKCAYTLMQQRIISHPKDMMGILLFGTEKTKYTDSEQHIDTLQYPHCYQLTDMDVPAADDVKMLRDLVNGEDDEGILQASEEQVSMSNVLFCANQIFTTRAANFSSRRLFIVTDNAYPHADSKDAREAALVRARDLKDLNVQIELFPIVHPEKGFAFDRTRFYNDVIYSNTPADPDAQAPLHMEPMAASSSAKDGISLLQNLLSAVTSRAAPRRTLNKDLKFEIAPGLTIGVNSYVILKKQEPQRTSFIYLPTDDDKPQITTLKSTIIAEDTARTVEKTEIRKAFKFGGETIYFTPEELKQLKNFGEPVIRIIGFKPISMLPLWANVTKSTYIYPSEEQYVGSTRVFSALWQKLWKDQKMGLAWYVARRNAAPVIAAILPGKDLPARQERDEFGNIIVQDDRNDYEQPHLLSAGLWIKPLPFADDIRKVEPSTHIVAPQALIDPMYNIITQMSLPRGVYDPRKYPNPALQWHYKVLQALALEDDHPDKDKDKTIPAYRQIQKRAGQYIQDWGEELNKAYSDWSKHNPSRYYPSATAGALKHSLPGENSNGTKRVKAEADSAAPDEDQFRKAYQQETLAKYKVADLKSFAASKGLATAGKKNDLVNAITQYFETKMDVD